MNVTMKGYTGVTARMYSPQVGDSYAEVLVINDKLADLRTVLRRGLNTREAPPAWLLELSDMLEHAPGGTQRDLT